ncbi:hypothetical protein HY632_00160 [Candidatus Uhrbacteria bacterium]|nr:hypothetical protein [Candidatus Uhrbacteria bacterium]
MSSVTRINQQPEAELPKEPRSEVAAEREARATPEDVTAEYLRTVVESAVRQAESRAKSIQEAQSFIAQRVELYGDKLTDAESAKFQEILADADRRLGEIKDAGAQAAEARLGAEVKISGDDATAHEEIPDALPPDLHIPAAARVKAESAPEEEMEMSFEMPKMRTVSAPEDLPIAEPAARKNEAPPDLDFEVDEDVEGVKRFEEAKQQAAVDAIDIAEDEAGVKRFEAEKSKEDPSDVAIGVRLFRMLDQAKAEGWSAQQLEQKVVAGFGVPVKELEQHLSARQMGMLWDIADDEIQALRKGEREDAAIAAIDISEDKEGVERYLAEERKQMPADIALGLEIFRTIDRAKEANWTGDRMEQAVDAQLAAAKAVLTKDRYGELRSIVADELERAWRKDAINDDVRAYAEHPESKLNRWLPKAKQERPRGDDEVEAEIIGDPVPRARPALDAGKARAAMPAGAAVRGLLGDGPAIPAERIFPDDHEAIPPGERPAVRGYLESGDVVARYVPEKIAGVPAFEAPRVRLEIPASTEEGARPEAKPGRKYTARELLNLGKIRDRHGDDLESLVDAMGQAKYAEAKGILETERVRGTLKVLVEAMGAGAKLEDQQAQLSALATELGIDQQRVRELYLQQFGHVDDLARQQVEQRGPKGKLARLVLGLGKAGARIGAYAAAGAGLMALAGPFGMAGIPALRAAENALLDRRKRGKVEEAAAAIRAELSTGTGDYSEPFLEKFARDLAIAKQQQIDQVDESAADGVRQNEIALDAYRDAAKREKGAVRGTAEFMHFAGVSEALRARYIAEATRHLTEQHPDLSEEARGEMGRLAGAVFTMDQHNAVMEAEQSGRAKSFFSRGVQFIEKTLGSKWLRGGEKPSEKTVTALIYGSLGFLARSTPGVARVMEGYAGMKAAELAARGGMAVLGGERYAGLRHGSAEEFRSAIDSGAGDPKLLARIHQQLLDPEFRKTASLSEQAAVTDAARRLENQIAAGGMARVDQHSDELEDAVVQRERRDRERKAIIGGARIAGLILGATLGPAIIEAIRPRPLSETDPLQKHDPHFENTRFVTRADADLFRMAQIKEGDGLTQVLQRQLEHAPDVYGFKGAPEDVHKWALAEAKRIAAENGYLSADGRTTATGLRFFGEGNSGGVLLHPSGQLEKIGPAEDYDTWLAHAKGGSGKGGGSSEDWVELDPDALDVNAGAPIETGLSKIDAEVSSMLNRIAQGPLTPAEYKQFAGQLGTLEGRLHKLEQYAEELKSGSGETVSAENAKLLGRLESEVATLRDLRGEMEYQGERMAAAGGAGGRTVAESLPDSGAGRSAPTEFTGPVRPSVESGDGSTTGIKGAAERLTSAPEALKGSGTPDERLRAFLGGARASRADIGTGASRMTLEVRKGSGGVEVQIDGKGWHAPTQSDMDRIAQAQKNDRFSGGDAEELEGFGSRGT